jgi:hypothetical protein
MSTRKIPGSKAGRCISLTTYHLLVLNIKKIRGLNLPDSHEPVQACSGTALVFITDDARCTRGIKSRTATVKAAFKRKTLFTSKSDLNLRKKPVKCYIWSIALYGHDTWILQK